MAQIPFRGNLQQVAFPLLSTLSSRTIIDPGADQTYVPAVSPDGSVPQDRGIPGAYYCHNIMPSTYGWQSVGFSPTISNALAEDTPGLNLTQLPVYVRTCDIFDVPDETEGAGEGATVEEIRPDGNGTYVAIGNLTSDPATYQVYVLQRGEEGEFTWLAITGSQELGIDASTALTAGTVNGYTYICLSEIGFFVFTSPYGEAAAYSMQERTLNGLDTLAIEGIIASQGYLLAYSSDSISWSSPANVEEFNPDEVTGAGGGSIQEARGTIVCARETYLGFILFTTGNAVSVVYSGNEDYPWTFKAISSSGGVDKAADVTVTESGGYHHAYTKNGIQQVSHQRASTVMPHITDFVSGYVYEDFDTSTNTFNQVVLSVGNEMRHALALVADRYLVVSYGLGSSTQFTHAIIVDLVQQRMGKLKIPHVGVIERSPTNLAENITVKTSVGFVGSTGQIWVVDFTPETSEDSVLVLGKYQLRRQRTVEIQELILENPSLGADFTCIAAPSLDGKNFSRLLPGYPFQESTNLVKFLFDGAIGENVSFILKGGFNLITFVFYANMHGRY